MSQTAAELAPRKTHKQENFPVASFILKPRHRAAIMAFYRFARTAGGRPRKFPLRSKSL